MLKTLITPGESDCSLTIPPCHIGKTTEAPLFSDDEFLEPQIPTSKEPSRFFGTLSTGEGEKFQDYLNPSRQELWRRPVNRTV
jgi:hypothetical protein